MPTDPHRILAITCSLIINNVFKSVSNTSACLIWCPSQDSVGALIRPMCPAWHRMLLRCSNHCFIQMYGNNSNGNANLLYVISSNAGYQVICKCLSVALQQAGGQVGGSPLWGGVWSGTSPCPLGLALSPSSPPPASGGRPPPPGWPSSTPP